MLSFLITLTHFTNTNEGINESMNEFVMNLNYIYPHFHTLNGEMVEEIASYLANQ